MRYSELIQLYFERSNALQAYWTLYVVVIGGLLAFSSLRKQRDFFTTALVTVLFAFFAYKNLDAIHDATLQRFATLSAIKQASTTGSDTPDAKVREALEPTLTPPAYAGVRTFHVTSDLLTIITLWAMERRRAKSAA